MSEERKAENCSSYPACYIAGDCSVDDWKRGFCGLPKKAARTPATPTIAARTCSFCPKTATTHVSDESDVMACCASCEVAWRHDPGFRSNSPTIAAQIEALASVDVAYNGPLVALIRTNLPAIVTALRQAEAANPVEAIARAVFWHHYGLSWENAEQVSRAEVCEMVAKMLAAGTSPTQADKRTAAEIVAQDRGDWQTISLQAEIDKGIGVEQWIAQNKPPQAEAAPGVVEALREALRPFVKHWQPWMDDTDANDDGQYNWPDTNEMSCFARVTYGDLRRAREALARQHGAREPWQAIESAPRDGTPFIATLKVRHINGQSWQETHVIWCDDETGDVSNDCENGWSINDYEFWMPLPAAPATDVGEI